MENTQFYKPFYQFRINKEIEQKTQIYEDQLKQQSFLQSQQQELEIPKYEISWPLNFILSPDKQLAYMAMSDRNINIYQIHNQGITQVGEIKQAHEKKINQLIIEDNMLFSCSNDGTVKIWDASNYKQIDSLKKQNQEITSISKSKYILAGGSDKESILFWDLQKMKFRGEFKETLNNDVTSVNFHKQESTNLLAGSLDGMLAQMDLTQQNEEDSCQLMMKIEQPIEQINFINNSKRYAYVVSTANTIDLIDLQESVKALHIDCINFLEYNEDYLIDIDESSTESCLKYWMGNADGQLSQYQVTDMHSKPIVKKIQTGHKSTVTCIKEIQNNVYLSCCDRGILELSHQNNNQQEIFQEKSLIDMEEEQQYYDTQINPNIQQNSNQKTNIRNQIRNKQNNGNTTSFNPL
ncbi:WD40-repeat-containing domain [Pseudocohnilembus persalinus]|uniref:WD40-repeat-containing domain n=1 Tax=Pseudocohnilembus persalinus TaxID=266149 RepID=A0A0V0QBX6_PSEPJ|nr:WD40-repeat-containing domain [Pseudocohnilembus persalinus]|eukprot:KRW99756.1 WD40-repeat-containing domain [Pseudocohnilembus persalinus]